MNLALRDLAKVTALAAIALFLLQGCAVNPATGGPNLVLMSENRELEIGEEEHEKIIASAQVVEDEP